MAEKNHAFYEAIWEVTEALHNEQQMENGLSACLSVLGRTLSCENGLAWLFDEKDERLYVIACYGKTDATGVSIRKDQGLLGKVYSEQETVFLNDCQKNALFSIGEDEEAGIKTEKLLTVPLKTSKNVLGCIQLINKKDGDFTEQDAMFAGQVAALCALDIEDKGYSVQLRTEKEPIISLRGVTKVFPSGDTELKVLKGIDLDIYEGEFLVILGESGCGKSTMLNIIGGMDNLTDGTITVDGKDFSHPTDHELTIFRRDYIGFVFQSYNLMPNLSAQENIEFVAENSKDPLPVDEALKIVGMYERAGHFPAQMSGGQQQRISIARALAKNPRMILADEPTAALDFQTGQDVLAVVEDIVRNQKKTVVMITHNVEIAKMADRVIKLRGGLISSVRINLNPLGAREIIW